jgi:hypothetical protein
MLLSVFSIIAKLAPWSPPRYPVPVTLSPVALEPVALEPVALEPVALEPVALEPWSGGRGPVAVVPSP